MHHIRSGQCGSVVSVLHRYVTRHSHASRWSQLVTAGHRAVTVTCDQLRSAAVHWTRKCDIVTTSALQHSAGTGEIMEWNATVILFIYFIRRKIIKYMGGNKK